MALFRNPKRNSSDSLGNKRASERASEGNDGRGACQRGGKSNGLVTAPRARGAQRRPRSLAWARLPAARRPPGSRFLIWHDEPQRGRPIFSVALLSLSLSLAMPPPPPGLIPRPLLGPLPPCPPLPMPPFLTDTAAPAAWT
jgi:hypothetical protein